MYKKKAITFRWRLNEIMLQEEAIVKDLKKKLINFF